MVSKVMLVARTHCTRAAYSNSSASCFSASATKAAAASAVTSVASVASGAAAEASQAGVPPFEAQPAEATPRTAMAAAVSR